MFMPYYRWCISTVVRLCWSVVLLLWSPILRLDGLELCTQISRFSEKIKRCWYPPLRQPRPCRWTSRSSFTWRSISSRALWWWIPRTLSMGGNLCLSRLIRWLPACCLLMQALCFTTWRLLWVTTLKKLVQRWRK